MESSPEVPATTPRATPTSLDQGPVSLQVQLGLDDYARTNRLMFMKFQLATFLVLQVGFVPLLVLGGTAAIWSVASLSATNQISFHGFPLAIMVAISVGCGLVSAALRFYQVSRNPSRSVQVLHKEMVAMGQDRYVLQLSKDGVHVHAVAGARTTLSWRSISNIIIDDYVAVLALNPHEAFAIPASAADGHVAAFRQLMQSVQTHWREVRQNPSKPQEAPTGVGGAVYKTRFRDEFAKAMYTIYGAKPTSSHALQFYILSSAFVLIGGFIFLLMKSAGTPIQVLVIWVQFIVPLWLIMILLMFTNRVVSNAIHASESTRFSKQTGRHQYTFTANEEGLESTFPGGHHYLPWKLVANVSRRPRVTWIELGYLRVLGMHERSSTDSEAHHTFSRQLEAFWKAHQQIPATADSQP